jgi:hypothetical protein
MADRQVSFTEEEIQHLFGHEAAENEDPTRLRQYYFKSPVYDKIAANLPLRVLVGHKGIGKSALFQIAIQEDRLNDRLPIEIRPDDVAGMASSPTDFVNQIRAWKDGIRSIVSRRAIETFGLDADSRMDAVTGKGLRILDFLRQVLQPTVSSLVNLTPVQTAAWHAIRDDRPIVVYLDDLDRGWEGRKQDITRLSALLNALRDLSRDDPGLKFRVALRSDVYFLVRTADESTDKIEGSVIWYTWTNQEILLLLVKRVLTYLDRGVADEYLVTMSQANLSGLLEDVMETRFSGRGHWANAPMYRVLMSLVRRRPRDLVKLLTLAARRTNNRRGHRITTADLEGVFEDYSQGRVQDTINEHRSEVSGIERLIFGMRPNRKERTAREGYVYTTDALHAKLRAVSAGGGFSMGGRALSPHELAGFLYKINFLTARKDHLDGLIERRYFEDNRYLAGGSVDFGYDWEVHPAYRWALQPESLQDIFNQIKLSRDD